MKYEIKKTLIIENLNFLNEVFSKHFGVLDLKKDFIFKEIKKCNFFIEEKNKCCNKKIKDNKDDFCSYHIKLQKMMNNIKDKNKNIDNFILKKYDDKYFIDVFDNIFTIDGDLLIHQGLLIDNELIFIK